MTTPVSTGLASIEELKARLDWDLDDDELRIAQSALDDLSDDARHYGSDGWDEVNAPRQAKLTVLRAAVRFMRNPEGYVQSRAGDETVAWSDLHAPGGSPSFTSDEKELLAQLAGKPGEFFGGVQVVAWGTKLRPCDGGYVPVATGGDEFPLYCNDEDPW